MKLKILVLMIILTAVFVFHPCIAKAGYNEESKVEAAIEVLNEIMKIREKSIPPALLRNTYGVAVIPGVLKAGFVLGGRYGQGILVVRAVNGSWSNPVFITLTGASVGFQIGVQSTDVVLVFKSRKSVDSIIKSKVTLGADASVAAGPVGRQASAATDLELKAEIYSYSRSRGIFAGVALDGAALQIDSEATAAFYSVEDSNPNEVFTSKKLEAPPVADKFKQLLTRYSGTE